MSQEQKIRALETKLRNNPHGIPNSKLPKDKFLIDWMKQKLTDGRAMWVFHNEWYFVLLRDQYTLPFNTQKWKWER